MPIYDLFSKRQKRLRGELPDVYTYDELPEKFRIQVLYIWDDTLISEKAFRKYTLAQIAYGYIVKILCKHMRLINISLKKYSFR